MIVDLSGEPAVKERRFSEGRKIADLGGEGERLEVPVEAMWQLTQIQGKEFGRLQMTQQDMQCLYL